MFSKLPPSLQIHCRSRRLQMTFPEQPACFRHSDRNSVGITRILSRHPEDDPLRHRDCLYFTEGKEAQRTWVTFHTAVG